MRPHRLFIAAPLGLITALTPTLSAQTSFTSTSATTAWNAARWNNTADGPTYTATFTANNAVNFTSGTYTFAGMGATVNVGNVTLSDDVTVSFTSVGSTYATGGAVRTINVGTNSHFNMASQSVSTAAGTGFIKTGSGIWTTAGGAYTGGFTLNAGTIALAGVNGMGGGATQALTINGGTIRSSATNARDLTGKYGAGITIGGDFTLGDATSNGALTFSNNIALGAANRTITVNSTATFGGVISGSAGVGLTKSGAGTLILGGANTYTGGTVVNEGALGFRVTAAKAATGTHSFAADTTLGLGLTGVGAFSETDLANAIAGTMTGNLSGITITPTTAVGIDTSAGDFTPTVPIAGSRMFAKTGGNNLILNLANSHSGGTTLRGGVLIASHDNALGSGALFIIPGATRLTVTDGVTIANDITLSGGGVAGRGLIENSGAGNSTLSGGTITISAPPSAGGHFAATGGGTLTVASPVNSASSAVTSRIGTVIFSGGGSYSNFTIGQGTVRLGATNGLSTSATVDVGVSAGGNLDLGGFNQTLVGIVKSSGNAGTIGNSSTTADSTLTITGTSTFAGIIKNVLGSGTRTVALAVNGGNLTLTGANTYTGGTSVIAGTLVVGNTSALGDASGNVTVAAGATLDLGGFAVTNTIINNGGTLLGANNYAPTVAQTLTGTSSYSGTIGGALTVASSGTLKGTATFTGAVVIQGVHAPGNSPGIQTFGAGVTYDLLSSLEWEFVGDSLALRGTDFDGVDVTGGDMTIVSGASLKLLASGVDYTLGVWNSVRNFTIVDNSGSGTTSGTFNLDTSLAGTFAGEGAWSVITTSGVGGDTILTWTPVPEPSTYAALAGLAALGLAWKRRRRA